MPKQLSAWNMLVARVYKEGRATNPDYKLKDAMKEASGRKSEMGHMSASPKGKSKRRTASASAAASGGRRRKTRRSRK